MQRVKVAQMQEYLSVWALINGLFFQILFAHTCMSCPPPMDLIFHAT
jgi:hypothetical protein